MRNPDFRVIPVFRYQTHSHAAHPGPSRQAAEHRRGGGREVVSIPRVEGRTGGSARGAPGVANTQAMG